MIITKTCNTCEHFPNDKHCVGCVWDKGENTKWELKKNPIVIERAVLDKIRNEITMLPIFNRQNVIDIIDKYISGKETDDE